MEDLSDNEREEQLRRCWAENWLWIVGGIALGLGGLAGWQYWQQSKVEGVPSRTRRPTSPCSTRWARTTRTRPRSRRATCASLHPKSPYADQADLALARFAVDTRDFDEAAKRLRTVADASRDPELRADRADHASRAC